jgi:hypothetical protein
MSPASARGETWHFPYFNDEMGAAVEAGSAASDTMLLGRVTYQIDTALGRLGRSRSSGRSCRTTCSTSSPCSRTFTTGVLNLTYEPVGSGAAG